MLLVSEYPTRYNYRYIHRITVPPATTRPPRRHSFGEEYTLPDMGCGTSRQAVQLDAIGTSPTGGLYEHVTTSSPSPIAAPTPPPGAAPTVIHRSGGKAGNRRTMDAPRFAEPTASSQARIAITTARPHPDSTQRSSPLTYPSISGDSHLQAERLRPISTSRQNEHCKPRPHCMEPRRKARSPPEHQSLQMRLDKLVGQTQLKRELLLLQHALHLDKRRRATGVAADVQTSDRVQHFLFMGNPGTGKTRMARELASSLCELGVLAKGHLVEVQRSDLVGSAIGKTAEQTRAVIERATGGVLFIDEAYTLVKKGAEKDFGVEALEELMRAMDEGKVVMIFAGYEGRMKEWMEANMGLYRRITKQFTFVDYTSREIAQIALAQLKCLGFTVDACVTLDALAGLIGSAPQKMRSYMNGGVADSLVARGREALDARLAADCDTDALWRLSLVDFEQGMSRMTAQWHAVQK